MRMVILMKVKKYVFDEILQNKIFVFIDFLYLSTASECAYHIKASDYLFYRFRI